MEANKLIPKKDNDKYGFSDLEGNWVIEPKYDEAGEFNYYDTDTRNPLNAPITLNGHQGRVRPDGSYLIEPVYNKIWGYTEGFAIVKKDGKWGYIKSDGRFLAEPQYDMAMEFSNGKAYVKIGNKKGYIDRNGKWCDEKPMPEE